MMGSDEHAHNGRQFPSSEAMDSLTFDSPRDFQRDPRSSRAGNAFLNNDPLGDAGMNSGTLDFTIDGDDDVGDPPSYQEAMGASYPGEVPKDSNPSMEASFPLGSPGEGFLHVSVSDPRKIQEANGSVLGTGTYFTYLVTTRTNLPGYPENLAGNKIETRRRFRDFVTLADRLVESHRGYFIPSRPDKNVVESQVMQSKDFIDMRLKALEKYLQRLANHPVICKSKELQVFLTAEGRLPMLPPTDVASRVLDGAVKLPQQLWGGKAPVPPPWEATQPAKGGRDLLRLFKELRQSVSNDWVGSRPAVMEEDKDFLERKERLVELEKQLAEVSAQAELLVKAQLELGDAVNSVGFSFQHLARFEHSSQPLQGQVAHAEALQLSCEATLRSFRALREANGEMLGKMAMLHEYLAMMQAVHAAFADRAQALLTVQTLTADLAARRDRIDQLRAASSKVLGGDAKRARQISDLEAECQLADDARQAAAEEYTKIKDRNRVELERFEAERVRDFYGMLEGIVRSQVACSERSVTVWENLAADLGGTAGSAGRTATGPRQKRDALLAHEKGS